MKIAKKSYEISYALFRLAGNLKDKNFGDHLEYHALRLLTSAAVSDFQSLEQTLKAAETILRFGADVNIIANGNKESIIAAIGELRAAVAEKQNAAKVVQELNLDDILAPLDSKNYAFRGEDGRINFQESGNDFSSIGKNRSGLSASLAVDGENDRQNAGSFAAKTFFSADKSVGQGNEAVPVAANGRKEAILERIRQNNDCRLKDIQEYLPNVSERTLRYDLQKLCEEGLAERVGSGGPGSYYRLRNAERLKQSA